MICLARVELRFKTLEKRPLLARNVMLNFNWNSHRCATIMTQPSERCHQLFSISWRKAFSGGLSYSVSAGYWFCVVLKTRFARNNTRTPEVKTLCRSANFASNNVAYLACKGIVLYVIGLWIWRYPLIDLTNGFGAPSPSTFAFICQLGYDRRRERRLDKCCVQGLCRDLEYR